MTLLVALQLLSGFQKLAIINSTKSHRLPRFLWIFFTAKNCEPELSYVLPDLFKMFLKKILVLETVGKINMWPQCLTEDKKV